MPLHNSLKCYFRLFASTTTRSIVVITFRTDTGSGLLDLELAKLKDCHFDIVALDISENMIRQARENARR